MTTVTQAVEALVRKAIGLSDADMGREWKWGVYDEEGLRFALLMTHHELRDLAVRLAAKRPARTQAAAILAQYHQAYRDLSGALAPVRTEDLDRAPAEGEWPVREVCLHMLGAEYGFLRVCRIALERHRSGKAGEPAERDRLSIRFGATQVASNGLAVENYDEAPVAAHLKGQEIEIGVDLGLGEGRATVWTCDLTHGYISINADYRS